jgi:transposase
MSNEPMNFDDMSLDQLQVMSTQVLQVQLKKVTEYIERLNDRQLKHEKVAEIRGLEIESRISKLQDFTVDRLSAKQTKYGWVTQSQFGEQFDTPISSHRVGKLLRVAGIAKKQRKTTPYNQYLDSSKLADSYINDKGIASIVWNYTRCRLHINTWLEQKGLLTEFYSITNKDELHKFIDYLHEKYIGRLE